MSDVDFFFFSSRRRHTRYWRDWSSDVVLFRSKLGCQVVHLNATPDGQFPHEPEPTEKNLTGLADEVRRQRAAVGFAQDPDADRLAIVDENGKYIGAEFSLALCADRKRGV